MKLNVDGSTVQEQVRVGLLGLGVIGKVHRAVLGARADVRLAFVVDPREVPPEPGDAVPRFRSLRLPLSGQQVPGAPVARAG